MDIDHLFSQVKGSLKLSHFWLVILLVVLIASNLAFANIDEKSAPYQDETVWSSGGPAESLSDYKSGTTADLLSETSVPVYSASGDEGGPSFIYVDSGLAVGVTHSYSNVIPTRQGLKKYKVREGDTLSDIAATFGVTLDTIKLANLSTGSVITPGEELTILPVSGIMYEIEGEDTVESVAAKYRINPLLIEKYNTEYQKLFNSPGESVILPYAKPINRWSYTNEHNEDLPNLDSYFTLPAVGWNWGQLHSHNAVDIAADCGEPIYASAEGLVAEESGSNYQNEGYGNYILIEHPNGTKTKYAHTLKNLVSEGDYVLQGEEIALIGSTGNTDGPTGCHLHFEVYGAQNPFAVK